MAWYVIAGIVAAAVLGPLAVALLFGVGAIAVRTVIATVFAPLAVLVLALVAAFWIAVVALGFGLGVALLSGGVIAAGWVAGQAHGPPWLTAALGVAVYTLVLTVAIYVIVRTVRLCSAVKEKRHEWRAARRPEIVSQRKRYTPKAPVEAA